MCQPHKKTSRLLTSTNIEICQINDTTIDTVTFKRESTSHLFDILLKLLFYVRLLSLHKYFNGFISFSQKKNTYTFGINYLIELPPTMDHEIY